MNNRTTLTPAILICAMGLFTDIYGLESANLSTKNQTNFTPSNEFFISSQVNSDGDDAEESTLNGVVQLYDPDLDLVDSSTYNQVIGLRFNGLSIPSGSVVDHASIQFTAKVNGNGNNGNSPNNSTGPTSLIIWGQDADDPELFVHDFYDVSDRQLTSHSVLWNPEPWTTDGEAGPDQATPDLSAVIQEIIDRPGWMEGNSIVLIIGGSGQRRAESHDGSPAEAPVLNISFRTCPPAGTICDDDDPLTINDRMDEFCNCEGHPAEIVFGPKMFLTSVFNPFSVTPETQLTTVLRDNGLIPLNQPFNNFPWGYFGTESFASEADIPVDMVDWVLVRIRDGSDFNIVVAQYAGILKSTGEVKGIDGNDVLVTLTDADGYYVELCHQNHLPLVSAFPLWPDDSDRIMYDFTQAEDAAYVGPVINNPVQATLNSMTGLWYSAPVGNAMSLDCQIDINDINSIFVQYNNTGFYGPQDINLDGQIDINDINLLLNFYDWNCHRP